MIDVICWKWKPQPEYRSQFISEHVNILRNMVKRNLTLRHRFTCITDDPIGIDSDIRIIPLWTDYSDIPNAHHPKNPSCYRRLKTFSAEAKALIGERILSIDLDTVIVGNIDHIANRQDDFVIWGDTARNTHYNGGLWLLRAGTRTQVWDKFDPVESPRITKQYGIIGSDQAWISHILQGQDPKYTTDDGVYSFRNHIRTHSKQLPNNACIIMFHGHYDPWQPNIQRQYDWVREHYK